MASLKPLEHHGNMASKYLRKALDRTLLFLHSQTVDGKIPTWIGINITVGLSTCANISEYFITADTHGEIEFRFLVNRLKFDLFTVFWLILNQTEFCLSQIHFSNLSFFLCVYTSVLDENWMFSTVLHWMSNTILPWCFWVISGGPLIVPS